MSESFQNQDRIFWAPTLYDLDQAVDMVTGNAVRTEPVKPHEIPDPDVDIETQVVEQLSSPLRMSCLMDREDGLSPSQKYILARRYGFIDGVPTTQKQIADEWGVTYQSISAKERAALKWLRKELKSMEKF